MSHNSKTTPNRRSRLDQLAYGACAVAVAAVAILNLLAGCDPSPEKRTQSAEARWVGPAQPEPA